VAPAEVPAREGTVASRQDILAYVGRAAEDPNLLPMVQLDADTGPAARLLAHRQRGARPGPLACDAADGRALIDQGELAYRAPWLTITPAGQRSLRSPA
jgi:hypothetical protein